jgi:molybdate transport system substrate-binding protein
MYEAEESPRRNAVRKRPFLLPAGLIFAVLAGCRPESQTSQTSATHQEVSVAAAADLKFALDEISREFGKQTQGIRINVTYGSSGNFYSQLQNHAPFDLFLSADIEYPRKLSEQGLSLPGTEFTYAFGRLAIWVPADSPIDVRKLGITALMHPSAAHIALANPQHAPYGRAAEAALRSLGVYDSVKPKLVFGENVAQALQFVQSGSAEIGMVALSLAISPTVREQGRFWELPLDSYPRMEQGGVILKWAKDPEATRSFRAFLTKPEGRTIFRKYGFSLPGE